MEVQADVQKERCSLSGESATVSLGTISDNASTKAMAGSILNAYMPLERSIDRASSSCLLKKQVYVLVLDFLNIIILTAPLPGRAKVKIYERSHCVFLMASPFISKQLISYSYAKFYVPAENCIHLNPTFS